MSGVGLGDTVEILINTANVCNESEQTMNKDTGTSFFSMGPLTHWELHLLIKETHDSLAKKKKLNLAHLFLQCNPAKSWPTTHSHATEMLYSTVYLAITEMEDTVADDCC